MSRTALVIGAGVAGSVSAIAPVEAGWDVEVFEADEHRIDWPADRRP